MGAQALAAPVLPEGVGSHVHLALPVFASNARTAPRSMSARPPSPIEDPTITVAPATTGGEVT
jgi:hypothetical protein